MTIPPITINLLASHTTTKPSTYPSICMVPPVASNHAALYPLNYQNLLDGSLWTMIIETLNYYLSNALAGSGRTWSWSFLGVSTTYHKDQLLWTPIPARVTTSAVHIGCLYHLVILQLLMENVQTHKHQTLGSITATSRHSTIMPEILSQKWHIRLETACNMLKITTL